LFAKIPGELLVLGCAASCPLRVSRVVPSDFFLGEVSWLRQTGMRVAAWIRGGVPIPGGVQKMYRLWYLGTWFSRHGGVGMMVGLDNLRGLFQH